MSPRDARSSHYDVLGVPPDASAEQIEKAYHFFAEMYDDLSLATYSLLDAEELREVRSRIRQAYEVLRDPVARRDHDETLAAHAAAPAGPPPVPVVPVAAKPAAEVRPLPRVLPEPVTGESLRRAREERGVDLQQIASVTKIGVRFLEYIEADRHGALPAVVYLRGFVQEYARALGLDPRRTADAYLARLPKQA